jgi:hypothetical protein
LPISRCSNSENFSNFLAKEHSLLLNLHSSLLILLSTYHLPYIWTIYLFSLPFLEVCAYPVFMFLRLSLSHNV